MKRLGERIKKKRESMNLHLSDLAKKVGVSASALSQIENAKAFPSILTLKSIADSLHTSIGEIIGEHEALSKNPVITKEEKKFVKKNKSGALLYLLSHHEHSKQMETYFIDFIKNADSKGIMTPHHGQAFCFVVNGKVEFTLEEEKYKLYKGDSFYFNSGVEHHVVNVHGDNSELIWVITPPDI